MDTPTPVPLETLLAHREWVRRVAHAMVRDEDLAADLEQELWVQALERPPVLRGSLRGWIAATLRSRAVDRFRAESSRRNREQAASRPEGQRSTDDVVAEADGLKRVVNAVMELEEPGRSAVLLRYFEDLPPREIAARQGVPVETVRTRLKRAIAELRERFDRESRGGREAWCLALGPLLRAGGGDAAVPASAGLTLGGILMANKALAAAAVALLVAGAGWLAFHPPAAAPIVVGPGPVPVAAAPAPTPKPAAAAEPDADLPPPVDLSKCDRDLDLFGVVVDGADAPVAGAAVQVEQYPWQGLGMMNRARYFDMVPGPATRSAVDGTFRLRLRRGQTVGLRVRKEGLAERFSTHVLAGEKLRIVLARGADLAVTLLDPEGKPVPGARLRLWRQMPSYSREIDRAGVTGEDGRFLFDALPPGKAYLSADAPDRPLPNWTHVDIQPGKTTAVEVRIPVARVIEGTVTDAATGAPLAGARVGINWTMQHPVTTGADGTYRMEHWAPKQGTPELHARADGWVGLGIEVPDEGRLDFALRRGDSVTGRVVDAAGTPVAGAMVAIYPPDQSGPPPPGPQPFDYGSVQTGPDGRFVLKGLDHEEEFHVLAVSCEGHGRFVIEFPPPDKEGGSVDLGDVALPAARALEGVVLDAAGRPAAGVGVIAKGEFPDRGKRMPGGGPVSPAAARGNMEIVRTDDLGRFRFPGLSSGPWNLSATWDGQSRIEKKVAIPPGKDLLDVRLGGLAASGAEFRVLVVDEAGVPLEGIPVWVMPEGAGSLDKETNSAGLALFRGLVATRKCYVQIPRTGPRMQSMVSSPMQSVLPAGQELRFVLSEAAEVRGSVVDGDGRPLERMEVWAYLQDDTENIRGGGVTDERGEFHLVGPKGKPLRIVLPGRRVPAPNPKADPRLAGMPEPTPLRGEAANVLAPASGVRIVAAVQKLDRSLTCLVLDPDDRPVPGATVTLQAGPLRQAKAGADGRVKFEGLGADRVLVLVLVVEEIGLSEDAVPPAGVPVVPSGQTLTLRFTRGVALKGKVLLPDGSAAVGAVVRCFLPDSGINSAPVKTDAQGRFRAFMPEGTRPHVAVQYGGTAGVILSGFAESVDPAEGEKEIRLAPLPKRR